ncbi:MAG: Asp-tRNA(Asn)/Glu-tRNA(Gln) amidotransferase subunit GatB [Chloroflexi bacterium]|nr:Asp-tRNA(Asn)/Glu-tRNA(Gln) amidotransferase subunit GatB [Chloroflexota bacterium]
MDFEPVIGLEVHAQVLTQSKMFCGCSAEAFGAPPNTHVCPICLGMPGALPVINQAAVEATIMTALALHCEIPEYAKFDRKNYMYPDLLKGYQISQYDLPLSRNGWLEIESAGVTNRTNSIRRIGIRRVHLEEDTAKLFHDGAGSSLVDVNRAGVPLMEIVSQPELHSAEDVKQYAAALRQILRYIGVSSGDMEKGALRIEPNISLRPRGSSELSATRTEIKNLNSISAMFHAVEYELARQEKILRAGGRVPQETMGWDEARGVTVPQRSKEEAHDYRYFPEPDLPRLHVTREWVSELQARLPELPQQKRARYMSELGLSAYDAGVLSAERAVAGYFDASVLAGKEKNVSPKAISNWLTGEIFARLEGDIAALKILPAQLVGLIARINDQTISSTQAKTVLIEMMATGQDADTIIKTKGLAQVSDRTPIEAAAQQVIDANPAQVQTYLNGKEAVLNYLVGQLMKATKGQANPALAREIMTDILERIKNE